METNDNMKTDAFRFDQEDLDLTQRTYETAREGSVIVREPPITRSEFIKEQDIPSIFLRGVIPGATSSDKSEDPNFRLIRDAIGPEGVVLSSQEIQDIQDASCRRYKTDPNYHGVLDAYIVFVIGKGLRISPVDEGEEVAEYLKTFMKVNKLDGLDRNLVEEVFKSGEVFIRKFTKAGDKDARIPVIRFLRYHEISQIIYDEQDREAPRFYVRPYKDKNGATQKEEIPADQIIHVKFGDQKRGLPPFMVIMMQCAYYDDWLFNRIVFNRLKTAYYLEEIVQGSPSKVSSLDSQTPSAVKTGERGKVIKRVPKPGSKITHNASIEYKWLKPEVNAEDAKEDGRAIRLSICSGAQVPEFILGDANNANYSSSLVAQNPFVRKMEFFQDFFEPHFMELCEWAIGYGIMSGSIKRFSTKTLTREKAQSVHWLKRIPKTLRFFIERSLKKNQLERKAGDLMREQEMTTGDFVTKAIVVTSVEVIITWPNLITQDLLRDTQAYQIHQAMGIVSDQTLSQRLGYEWEDEKQRLTQQRAETDQDDDGFGGESRDEEIEKGSEGESDGS